MRLLDEQTFELRDRLQLQQHELACSVCRWVTVVEISADRHIAATLTARLGFPCHAYHPLLVARLTTYTSACLQHETR